MEVGMRLVLAKKRSPNLRVASFWSQYQLVVNCMPSVFFRPRLWMSVRNTSRPTVFMLLLMPNSLAALMALMVSPPALARPRIWALEACACSRKEEKSRSEEHTSELQSQSNLVCRLLLEKKKKQK